MSAKGRGMLLGETIAVALQAIRSNKLRAFLTMLGIIIGIAAVITMVALGEGAQRSVEERLQGMGTNVLTVRPGQNFYGGLDRGAARLTPRDAEALQRAGGAIAGVSPELERRQQVVYGRSNANVSIVAVWPSFFSINNHSLAAGRLFTPGEERGRRRLAVVGSQVGERLRLSSTAELLGSSIRIGGKSFEVVGVLEEKGSQGFDNPDERIYIPLATGQFRVFGTDWVRTINVQAAAPGRMDEAMASIDQVLRREHRIRPGEPSDFNVRDQAALVATFEDTARTFGVLLAGIAALSLLVGGIGIMNIMLVSVTERTKEIGVRKALGARSRDIMLQFLIESLVLCITGGAIGVMVGVGGALALQHIAEWNAAVAPSAVLVAFGFSAAVGLFFGLWPARRAARLDPIQSLRYE
ncbi:MAG TPA: ABC transporter permease [Longimicrobiales bacterium]|nr:ABC transporter permease [Longimicrobiales bacterium]